MNERKWLILTALSLEAKAIEKELRTLIDGKRVRLQVIGIRACRLTKEMFAGIDGGLILAGLGGGLDPSSPAGDVILDDPMERVTSRDGFIRGKIYTADHLISDTKEKATLFRETGCIAVDMEGKSVRTLANELNLPMIHLRAISDAADESLPPNMADWVDELGEPRMARVAKEVALRPQLIPALMRLQKNSKLALEKLAKGVHTVIQQLTQEE